MRSYIELIILSAIWGSSFLFMRIAAPILGAAWLVFGRVSIAALFLFFVIKLIGKKTLLRKNLLHYSILAFFNSALPFFLFSCAASTLNASQMSVVNATSPVWGYIIGVFVKNEEFAWIRVAGIVLGFFGVLIMIGVGTGGDIDIKNVLMVILAAFSYGAAANYMKKRSIAEPYLNAFGSMLMVAFIVMPSLFFFPVKQEITNLAIISVISIGVMCSGVAYMLYFRIINELGASSALAVTFLIPIFATIWGALFLQERIGLVEIIGASIVILGTYLATKKVKKTVDIKSDNMPDY